MDFEQPRQQPPMRPQPHQHQPEVVMGQKMGKRRGRGLMKAFLVIVLIAAAGAGAYWWRDKEAGDQEKKLQAQNTALQAQVSSLQSDLAAANKSLAAKATAVAPSAATLDNIKAAVTSGNYAALEGLMASSVKVIIAASEGLGARTPVQAVADVKYLDGGTDPWDFALSAAVIDDYQAGDYKQYFPDTALVGKSANKYVVSFQFDANAKISGIFMAANADLL